MRRRRSEGSWERAFSIDLVVLCATTDVIGRNCRNIWKIVWHSIFQCQYLMYDTDWMNLCMDEHALAWCHVLYTHMSALMLLLTKTFMLFFTYEIYSNKDIIDGLLLLFLLTRLRGCRNSKIAIWWRGCLLQGALLWQWTLFSCRWLLRGMRYSFRLRTSFMMTRSWRLLTLIKKKKMKIN